MFVRDDFLMLAPPRRHPHADAVERASTALAAPLLDPVTARRFAATNRFAAYVFPDAPPDLLLTASLWVNWMYLFDDEHDEDAQSTPSLNARIQRSVAILRGEAAPVDALDDYLALFRSRAAAAGSAAWLDRFADSAAQYLLQGTLASCAAERAGDCADVEAYLARRAYDGAVETALDLIELHCGADLPARVRADPAFQGVRAATSRAITCFNDIVSYPKEVIVQKSPSNLVAVIGREQGCSVEEALRVARDRTNHAAADVIALEAALLRRHPVPGLRAVLAGYRALQTGNITASLGEARYRSALSPLAELRLAA